MPVYLDTVSTKHIVLQDSQSGIRSRCFLENTLSTLFVYILYINSTSTVQLLHSSSTLCSTKAYCIRISAVIMSLKNIVANNTKLKVYPELNCSLTINFTRCTFKSGGVRGLSL